MLPRFENKLLARATDCHFHLKKADYRCSNGKRSLPLSYFRCLINLGKMRRHALSKLQRAAILKEGRLLGTPCLLRFERSLANRSTEVGGQRQSLLSTSAAGLLAAAAFGGATFALLQDRKAECAAELPLPSANPKAEQFIDEFRHWLRNIGADSAAVDFKQCSEVHQSADIGLLSFTATCPVYCTLLAVLGLHAIYLLPETYIACWPEGSLPQLPALPPTL